MANMFEDTRPRLGDDLSQTLAKICQILTTGPVGPTSPLPYTSTAPSTGDEIGDYARKINQYLHVNG